MNETVLSIPDQIKKALDGRSQRIVALDTKIPESEFSRKMKNNAFTDDELIRIEERLKFKIVK